MDTYISIFKQTGCHDDAVNPFLPHHVPERRNCLLLGSYNMGQWTWYQTQTLSGALTSTVNLCFVYWGFIFIFIDLVKNTVLRTCKFMDDDLINICYQLPYCTPINIPFHESSQQWISQKYSIQCILIKPQYGKYFYPTLNYWLVPHRTSLKIFQLHKELKYYFKRCKILLLFWFKALLLRAI